MMVLIKQRFHNTSQWIFSPIATLIFFISFSACSQSFGQELDYQWAKQIGGLNQLAGTALHMDSEANVIVGGTWQQTIDFDPPNLLNTASNSNFANNSLFVAKYDSLGSLIWSFVLKTTEPRDLVIADIESDSSGNIYVGGHYEGPFDLDPSPSNVFIAPKTGSSDVFLAKYNKHGEFIWAVLLNGSVGFSSNELRDIELDSEENILITGSFEQIVDFDPDTTEFKINGSSNSTFIAKYSKAGDFLDMHYFYSPGATDSYPNNMSIDKAGNIFISGVLLSNNFFVDGFAYPGGPQLAGRGIFVIKLDNELDPVWYFNLGSDVSHTSRGMVLDDSANIYLTGLFEDPIDMDPDPMNQWRLSNPTYSFSSEAFIAKYDSSGALKWAKEFSGSNAGGLAVDLDGQNNIYVALKRFDTLWLNPGIDTSYIYSQNTGLGFAKLNSSGLALSWFNIDNLGFLFFQNNMEVNKQGQFAITSTFFSSIDLGGYRDTAIISSTNTSDAFVSYYGPCNENHPNCITNIDQGSLGAIEIYPNPNEGTFIIKTNESQDIFIQVLNLQGQVIIDQTLRKDYQSVNLPPHISNGIYILHIFKENGNEFLTKKIYINR